MWWVSGSTFAVLDDHHIFGFSVHRHLTGENTWKKQLHHVFVPMVVAGEPGAGWTVNNCSWCYFFTNASIVELSLFHEIGVKQHNNPSGTWTTIYNSKLYQNNRIQNCHIRRYTTMHCQWRRFHINLLRSKRWSHVGVDYVLLNSLNT